MGSTKYTNTYVLRDLLRDDLTMITIPVTMVLLGAIKDYISAFEACVWTIKESEVKGDVQYTALTNMKRIINMIAITKNSYTWSRSSVLVLLRCVSATIEETEQRFF